MIHNIISITKIQHEAQVAARTYTEVNDACPYPFPSEAGRVFKAAFLAARAALVSDGLSA